MVQSIHSKQLPKSILCDLLFRRPHFSRSYVSNLPNSLWIVTSRPLADLLPIHLCQFRVQLINFSNLELFLEILKRFFQFESKLRPSIRKLISSGMTPDFQSTTPFDLVLGADLLSMDKPCGETLGFSGYRILTDIFVTQADIITCAMSIVYH